MSEKLKREVESAKDRREMAIDFHVGKSEWNPYSSDEEGDKQSDRDLNTYEQNREAIRRNKERSFVDKFTKSNVLSFVDIAHEEAFVEDEKRNSLKDQKGIQEQYEADMQLRTEERRKGQESRALEIELSEEIGKLRGAITFIREELSPKRGVVDGNDRLGDVYPTGYHAEKLGKELRESEKELKSLEAKLASMQG